MIEKVVIWDEFAVRQLESQLDFIKEDSIIQAEKVRDKILKKQQNYQLFLKNIQRINTNWKTMEHIVPSKFIITGFPIESQRSKFELFVLEALTRIQKNINPLFRASIF